MAFAALLKLRRENATIRTEATGSVVVAMDDFLWRSDLRRALKSSRGSRRSSAAMCSNGNSSGSAEPTVTTGPARNWVTAWSNWSTSCLLGNLRLGRERLGIGTLHAGTQVLQGTELQLFYCAFGASQGLRDFTNTFLLGEAHCDHAALIGWKLVYQAKEPRALIGFLQFGPLVQVGQIRKILAGDLFRSAL